MRGGYRALDGRSRRDATSNGPAARAIAQGRRHVVDPLDDRRTAIEKPRLLSNRRSELDVPLRGPVFGYQFSPCELSAEIELQCPGTRSACSSVKMSNCATRSACLTNSALNLEI